MKRKNDAILQIRIPSDLRRRFQEQVHLDGRDASDFIREFIEVYVSLRDRQSIESRLAQASKASERLQERLNDMKKTAVSS